MFFISSQNHLKIKSLKKPLVFLLVLTVIQFSVTGISTGNYNIPTDAGRPEGKDTTIASPSYLIVKINPYQYVLSEIPVSIEYLSGNNQSIQVQLGFIIPKSRDFFAESFFEMNGDNGTASPEGIFSYRNTPFLNNGFSLKIEFKNYHDRYYFAPQVMIKHYSYSHLTFPVFSGSITVDQEESRIANVAGLGCILGQQRSDGNLTYEWYTGAGIRFRSMNTNVHQIYLPTGYKTVNKFYPKASIYPFINLGIRIGFRFKVG